MGAQALHANDARLSRTPGQSGPSAATPTGFILSAAFLFVYGFPRAQPELPPAPSPVSLFVRARVPPLGGIFPHSLLIASRGGAEGECVMVRRIAVSKLERFSAYARQTELNGDPRGGQRGRRASQRWGGGAATRKDV